MKTSIPPVLITFTLVCFALVQKIQAVSPPPDGGYPGGNTAEGQAALLSLTTGGFNTAAGFFSLRSNTTGQFNTAIGAGTLFLNTADENTATGAGALLSNNTGTDNTANGAFALFNNSTGSDNTANGAFALFNNTTGEFNTAMGDLALVSNTTGGDNTAIGLQALASNTTGGQNTGIGDIALAGNTTGSENTAIGDLALATNTTGIRNTALGSSAGSNLTTGNDNIDIDNNGVAGEFGTIRIGASAFQTRTFIAAIHGVTTGIADALPVVIDSAGQLGTMSSSRRFKTEIKPMDKSSEAILALKPVTFHYKSDSTNTSQFGLIAEQVAEVNPDLVARDQNGEIYTVRYDQINAMLLNEFLKEHRKVEAQQATISQLKNDFQTVNTQERKEIQLLSAQLKEQAAQIQRVSAQLEASKPAPQVVNNP
jgi:hypothetical protein